MGELTDRDLLDVTMKFIAPDGEVLLSDADTLPGDGGQLWRELTVRNPKLWWPHGHGEQPLYRLELQLSYQGQPLSGRCCGLAQGICDWNRIRPTHRRGKLLFRDKWPTDFLRRRQLDSA